MEPRAILEALIEGRNPVSNERIETDSPWATVEIVRALYGVINLAESLPLAIASQTNCSSVKKLEEPRQPCVKHDEPDLGRLKTQLREKTHTKLCAHCHATTRGNYWALTGQETLFVFCDEDCFEAELRALGRLFGWVSLFNSSLDDEICQCSVCKAKIRRQDHEHANFVVHDRNFGVSKEVAILCSSCRDKFDDYWEGL